MYCHDCIWEDILWICLLIRCCWRLVLYALRIYSEKDGKKITCHTVKMADSLAKIKIYRADLCHWILLFGKRGICYKIQSVDGIFSADSPEFTDGGICSGNRPALRDYRRHGRAGALFLPVPVPVGSYFLPASGASLYSPEAAQRELPGKMQHLSEQLPCPPEARRDRDPRRRMHTLWPLCGRVSAKKY